MCKMQMKLFVHNFLQAMYFHEGEHVLSPFFVTCQK